MSLENDPGRGSVDGIRALARTRRRAVDDLDVAAYRLAEAASWAAECWHGRSGQQFTAAMTDVEAEATAVARGLDHHGAALEAYATALSLIQGSQQTLEARREMAERDLFSTGATLATIMREAQDAAQADLYGLVVEAEYRVGERSTLQQRIDDARQELEVVASLWAELVEERAAIDQRCITALQGPEAMGALPQVTAAALATRSGEELLGLMAGLSATELTMLLRAHPELADTAFRADPERVRAWWDELGRQGARDADGLTALQVALVRGAPAIIGALDGLPPSVRIAANAVNAARRITEIDERARRLERRGLTGDAELLAALARERAYLEGAVAQPPTVQLYLFDPARSRIIEMIGRWDAETRTVATYVPGTFSDMEMFYKGPKGVQQIAKWMVTGDSTGRTVAFVYKDGIFPGEAKRPGGIAQTVGIAEANDYDFARRTSKALSDFQAGLSVDAVLKKEGVQTVALGHSWGLANITSSEVHGAHYDKVISLAGAGMPPEWSPRDDTRYVDFSYWDALQAAQETGQVWGGRNPNRTGDFEFREYYAGPKDVALGKGIGNVVPEWELGDNHSLVAEDNADNEELLRDLRKVLETHAL